MVSSISGYVGSVFIIVPASYRNTNRTKWRPSITVKHANSVRKTTDRMAEILSGKKIMVFLEWRHNAFHWRGVRELRGYKDEGRGRGTDSRLTAFDILMGQTSFWGPPFGDWLPPKRKIYDNITSQTMDSGRGGSVRKRGDTGALGKGVAQSFSLH